MRVTFGGTNSPSYEVGFDELSDGQRALVVLYALLHDLREGSTLIIDEPENYLSPREIQPWLAKACDRARAQGQLIVVSHNDQVIDYLAADKTLLLVRKTGGPTSVEDLSVDLASGQRAFERFREHLEGFEEHQ